MARRTESRLLAAASFLILMLAVVPGIAYTGSWSVPEGEMRVIVAEQPVSGHGHGQEAGHSHPGEFQQCRLGPSKCTSQPSFVATTWVGGDTWVPAPPSEARRVLSDDLETGVQPPVYRQKPPPREA